MKKTTERTFKLFVTNAPENYDGFGTVSAQNIPWLDYNALAYRASETLDDNNVDVKDTPRIVVIEDRHVEWHRNRYSSGRFWSYPLGFTLTVSVQDIKQ